jgi:hypothetical protein
VYHFKIFREWMGINRLQMMNVRNSPQTVNIIHTSFCL